MISFTFLLGRFARIRIRAGIVVAALMVMWSAPALAAITLSPVVLPNGTQTVAYDQTIVASGGTGPYTYAVTTGSLPAGLSLDGATGEITGTPTTTGFANFTVTATDSTSATGSRAYSISVGTASLTLLPASLPAATQGTAYSQTITAVGGTAPYTFSVSQGPLPAGLTLSSAGVLSGTPTANGSFGFILQATDVNGNTGFRTYSLVIGSNSLTLSPTSLPNGSQGTAYSQTVTASGGGAPYTYSIASGSLPAGLTLNSSTGTISGTPTSSGTSSFTIGASDTFGDTGSQPYSLTIGANNLVLNPTTLPNGFQGTAYNQTVTATGGTGSYTYSVTSGSLPAGLSLNTSTGAITGTPTGSGGSTFTIGAIDFNSDTGSRSYTVFIGTNSLTLSPSTLPNGTQTTPYSQTVTATGGTGPYTYAVTSGSLPAGLTLNTSIGVISGTPTTAGTASFTVGATDSHGNTGSQAYSINIGVAPLTVNPATLPAATQGTAYSQTITGSGGVAPYTYAIVSGALPAGLTLNTSTGVISGTPTATGAFNLTVQATDSASTPNTGTRAYTLNVGGNVLTVNPSSLPAGTQGTAYNQTVSATGGTGPYTFSVASGSLPAGLTLNTSTGAITGTPTGSGTANFTIAAADSIGNVGSRAYSVPIGTNSLTLSPSSLPAGVLGTTYNQTVSASGGTAPYTYSLSSGTLPSGLTLNTSTGAITGVPTASGLSNFTVKAVDSLGNVGTHSYSVNVGSNNLTLNPSTLPNATQGTAYSQTVTATGGTGPYTYSVSGGSLPAGLSLNTSTGAITGTPTGSGASAFTIAALDSLGDTGSRSYSVNVGTNSLTINPSTLPPGTKSLAYSQSLSATGGSGGYTYALASGALPAGLTLNTSTGAITGTPTANGLSNFTVRVADGNGDTGSRAFALNIGSNSLAINPTTLPAAVQGALYSQTVTATGGTGPYTYAIIAGALPPGLTFNIATGLISGTPTGTGTFSVTIQAQDSVGDISSRTYAAFQVRPNPATDPDVQGIVSAQAASARRFASTQVTNLTGHMEDLHNAFDPCLINVNFGTSLYNPMNALPQPPNTNPTMPGGNLPPACIGQGTLPIPLAFWTAGTVQFGSTSAYGSANQFTTGGLTVGVDGRLGSSAIAGLAFGYGTDRTDVGTDGTVTSSRNFDGMFYLSYQPVAGWFIDALTGYGSLNFQNTRFDSFDTSLYGGARTGSEWFASLTASTDIRDGARKVSPYVRTDWTSAWLQGYSEQGLGSSALTYGGTSFNSAAVVVGLRGTYDIPTSWGIVQPTARLELRHELDSGFNQSMFYTDVGAGQTYLLNMPDLAQNSVTAGVGVRARAGQNLSAEVEYRATAGNNSTFIQTISAILRLAF
jgi:uncharacterized protein YhjY with autotransporter beta-barrel domain